MDKQSTLHQLMGMRMNGVMNGITERDDAYQALVCQSDECTCRLDGLHLPPETRELIDQYASTCNAIGSRYGMLAYLLGFSDCRDLLLDPAQPGKEVLADGLL